MRHTLTLVLVRILAIAASVAWGFFVAFNVVFSDVFGAGEMAGAIAYVLAAYALLGLALGALDRAVGWKWVFWIAPVGLLLVGFALFDNPDRFLYIASVVAAMMAGAGGGGWLGARLVSIVLTRRDREAGGGAAV